MKKIMFNDSYGLTKAVLEGRKTMTQRIVPVRYLGEFPNEVDLSEAIYNGHAFMKGEVVAVAQAYKDVPIYPFDPYVEDTSGWNNKMFVRADLMPHQIRITNVRVERMQDISDEDCLKEGITKPTFDTFTFDGWKYFAYNPREAYADLIDKVSGKGTWASNPWVFVYEFELVK